MDFDEWYATKGSKFMSSETAMKCAWDEATKQGNEKLEKLRFELGTKNLTAFAEGTKAACPDDCVVVPVEPTDEMINSFWDVVQLGNEARPSDIYKAMIQAAKEEQK